jgi:hypothetical protein
MLRLSLNPLQTEINVPILTTLILPPNIYSKVHGIFGVLCNIGPADNEELITNAALGEENWLNA